MASAATLSATATLPITATLSHYATLSDFKTPSDATTPSDSGLLTITPKPSDDTNLGRFASSENDEDTIMVFAEPWQKYLTEDNPRIFYPICLGEVLNGRYMVEHKLGHGGDSTVWMAHDIEGKRDVALKVLSSGEWGENELRIQDEILKNVKDTTHIATYLSTFLLPTNIESHRHRVLVFPLLCPCVDLASQDDIPLASRMSAALQLLEALESLHEAGIMHRDLSERNCMWGMSSVHHLDRSAKYEVLGQPLKERIPSAWVDLWKEAELVAPMEIPQDLRTNEFYLGDFGIAKKVGDSTTQVGFPPSAYCSPERLLGAEPSFACDMWSYMIVFSVLYLDFPPFRGGREGGIISDIVNHLGPLPEDWKKRYAQDEALDFWYDQSRKADTKDDLQSIIAYYRPDTDPIERELVHSVMSKVFVYRPEERLTATELLKDPSFRAIMDKYGCL
ncbi:hypothetical protein N7513_000191 [Penicillium frequentans]|nr:hypothetical protein N7513_000191 [Penicillium glabrum]